MGRDLVCTRSFRRIQPPRLVIAADAPEEAQSAVDETVVPATDVTEASTSASSSNAVPYSSAIKTSLAKDTTEPPAASFLSVILNTSFDKEIAKLAFPALLTTLLDPVMTAIDAAIVGRLGTPQLAAVGACTVLYNFSNFVFNFLLYTTTPRIAAAASTNDMRAVSKVRPAEKKKEMLFSERHTVDLRRLSRSPEPKTRSTTICTTLT